MTVTGSYIPAEIPADHVMSAKALTAEGIMAKHDLTEVEFSKITRQLMSQKLSDILFHFPDGPRYDIALYLVATSR